MLFKCVVTRRKKVKKKKGEGRRNSCVCAFDVFQLLVSVFSVWCIIVSFVNVMHYIEYYCITCVRGFCHAHKISLVIGESVT